MISNHDINEALKEVKAIAEDRKTIKEFKHPIIELKANFKGLGWRFSRNKEVNLKPNPILNLSWYKDTVEETSKRVNIINSNDKFYRFGVYIKFNSFLSIKYKPYIIKEGGKYQERIKNNEPLLENVLKNFTRCSWCKKGINLKHKEEYGPYNNNKVLCCDCCPSEVENVI